MNHDIETNDNSCEVLLAAIMIISVLSNEVSFVSMVLSILKIFDVEVES